MTSESPLYDPHSPHLQARLHDVYRQLRDDHPLYHCPERNLYVVTRYADVVSVLQDPDTFANGGVEESKLLMPMIVYMDGEKHRALRGLVARAFTPRRVADLESPIRRYTRTLLDGAALGASCDFLHDVAAQLPSFVICELVGVPDDRRAAFLSYTERLITTGPQGHDVREPAGLIYAEFGKLLAERRSEPRDDLMSALVGSGELSEQELQGFCFNLLVGGIDTTMNLLTSGVALLAAHPAQRSQLARYPEGIPRAVEEMLRYESPTQNLPRTPQRDVEIHGVRVPAGSRLLVAFGAANRDERAFPDADRFDVERFARPGTARHLAFGLGNHFCPGSSLARLEGRVAFEELLARFPEYRVLETPGWVTSRWARSHSSLQVSLS